MKPIGFVAPVNPNMSRGNADALPSIDADPITRGSGDAFTPTFVENGSPQFVVIGNPTEPQGGLFDRLAGLEFNIPILGPSFQGAVPDSSSEALYNEFSLFSVGFSSMSDNWIPTKVLPEAPAMSMGELYQRHRPSIPGDGSVPQAVNNDAVTISAEAQAAADVLEPTS